MKPPEKYRLRRAAFTMTEMLVSITVVAVLGALIGTTAEKSRDIARGALCANSLRQLSVATNLYLEEHQFRLFPYYEDVEEGRRWYFGLEPKSSLGGAEGDRTVDMRESPLGPYINSVGGVEICPSFPYGSNYWKPKFKGASFGYGFNLFLSPLTLDPQTGKQVPTPVSVLQIAKPSEVILFGDCAQVNTFQSPASSSNPLLEEFYILDNSYKTVHFRHGNRANMLFLDGHVQKFEMYPNSLDSKLPAARVGRISRVGSTKYLQ